MDTSLGAYELNHEYP